MTTEKMTIKEEFICTLIFCVCAGLMGLLPCFIGPNYGLAAFVWGIGLLGVTIRLWIAVFKMTR